MRTPLQYESNFRIYPTPEYAAHPAFKALLTRDKTKDKDRAIREFAYIYHTVDPTSSYRNINPEYREAQVRKDFLEGKAPDKEVEAAKEVYAQFVRTALVQMFEAAEGAIFRMSSYFEDIEVTDDTVKDLVGVFSNLPKVVAGMRQLRDEVQMERAETGAFRGDFTPNKYSV